MLTVIMIVFGLAVLLLAVPIDVAFRCAGIHALNGQITIRWLFGLVRFRIRFPAAIKSRSPEPGTEPPAARVRVKPKPHDSRSNILAVFRQTSFRRRTYRLVKDLVHAAHLRQLRLRMRLGLGDPAETGCLWAFVGPLDALARTLLNADIRIDPEFIEPVFEFEAKGRVLLVPLQFLALAVTFALSPPSIRAWRTLRGRHA